MPSRRRTGSLADWGWPMPLPDELSIGLVPRALARWAGLDAKGLLEQYGVPARRLAHPILPVLPTLALSHEAGVDDIEARRVHISRHTLVPYYAAYASPLRSSRNWAAAMTPGAPNLVRLVVNGSVKRFAPSFLQYCVECVRADHELYREAYWHRHHQVPGVSRCAIHRTNLLQSNTPTSSTRLLNLACPPRTAFLPGIEPAVQPMFNEAFEQRVVEGSYIALRDDTYHTQFIGVDGYRAALKEVGLTDGQGRVRANLVSRQFESWLAMQGTEASTIGLDGWWLALFTNLAGASTPLQHITFRCFIEDVRRDRARCLARSA
jgi:hypothetical protein